MQTLSLRKLLHPIKTLMSRSAKRQSAETLELREADDMTDQRQDEAVEMQGEADDMPTPMTETASEADVPQNEEARDETKVAPTPQQPSNRAHLTTSVPRAAKLPQGALSKADIAEMRSILGDLDDTEIQRLYKKVTK